MTTTNHPAPDLTTPERDAKGNSLDTELSQAEQAARRLLAERLSAVTRAERALQAVQAARGELLTAEAAYTAALRHAAKTGWTNRELTQIGLAAPAGQTKRPRRTRTGPTHE